MRFEGEDAKLLRNTLHLIHEIGINDTLDAEALKFIESMDSKGDDYWLWFRSLFFGTASGLNRQLEALPWWLHIVVRPFFNHFLRSFGNMYECCNPWTGLLFFIALWYEDRWQLLVCSLAVISSMTVPWAIGSAPQIRSLGLLQVHAIGISQWWAYFHQFSPPTADWDWACCGKPNLESNLLGSLSFRNGYGSSTRVQLAVYESPQDFELWDFNEPLNDACNSSSV